MMGGASSCSNDLAFGHRLKDATYTGSDHAAQYPISDGDQKRCLRMSVRTGQGHGDTPLSTSPASNTSEAQQLQS